MMMLSEASMAMQGQLKGRDANFTSVEFDTRRLEPDALYFAIHGEIKNGHAFIAQAMQQHAAAVVADQAFGGADRVPHIRVDDTTLALGMLAAHWRQRFDIPVVGISGSNGKTTVCKVLSCLFARSIPGIAPQGSFNNQWGVPLTLLSLRQQHRSAIIEMGMNHEGELTQLGRIVRPTIGLITNAAAAHLEGLKDLQGVARAKGELIDSVTDDGVVVLNRDDPFYAEWKARAGGRQGLSFGEHPQADIRLKGAEGTRLSVDINGSPFEFNCALLGRHNQLNAVAAAAAAVAAGVSGEAIVAGMNTVRAVPGRLQLQTDLPDFKLFDDSYNANLASMQAAIDVLAQQPGYRVLILGAMRELGSASSQIHEQVGSYAREKGINRLLTLVDQSDPDYLGDMAAYLRGFGKRGAAYSEVDDLVDSVKALPGSLSVLVKGSRLARMERVVSALKQRGR